VLFVSGYTRDAIGPRDLVEPGTAYLAKPFTPASLVAQVRRLLEA
jgi:DNA-binding response OmpR family regulator